MESQSLNWDILGTSFISGIMAEAILKEEQFPLQRPAVRPSDSRAIMQLLTDWEKSIDGRVGEE